MQLSEKLRLLSSRYHLTQQQLGEELHIAHTTVGRWMSGQSRPYDRHAIRLAQLFGIKLEELMDDRIELPAIIAQTKLDPILAEFARQNPDQVKAGLEAVRRGLATIDPERLRSAIVNIRRGLAELEALLPPAAREHLFGIPPPDCEGKVNPDKGRRA